MSQTSPLSKQDPMDPDRAEEAAGRAGQSIEEWLAAALAEQAARMAAKAPPAKAGRRPAVAADPAAAKPKRTSRARPDLDPEEGVEALVAASAASERRAIETAAKTAMALGSVATWIERAQERLTETTRAASEAQERTVERTAAVVSEAVGELGERLDKIERTVEGNAGPGIAEALQAIERIEAKLTSEPAPRDEPSREGDFDEVIRHFDRRMAELSESLAAPSRAFARRGVAAPQDVDAAVSQIRAHQAALETSTRLPQGIDQLGALARSHNEILTSLRGDIAKLAGQLPAAPASGAPEVDGLRDELDALRGAVASLATRDDLGELRRTTSDLSRQVAEVWASGGSLALKVEEIETLQAELRRLSERREPAVDGRLAHDIDSLAHKLDIVSASGLDPALTDSLAGQLDGIRTMVADLAAPNEMSELAERLTELRHEVAEIGSRQVDAEDFASLKSTVDELRASMAGSDRVWSAIQNATEGTAAEGRTGAPQPIETMLAALIDKLDRVERRVAEPDALDQLERQIAALAARIGDGGAPDPTLSGLEQTMAALMTQVESWREGAVEAAEQAARAAVTETLAGLPNGFGAAGTDFERHFAALSSRYDAVEENTRNSLSTVHATLEDVIKRMAWLEEEAGRPPSSLPPVEAAWVPPTGRLSPATELPSAATRRAPARRGAADLSLAEADRPVPAVSLEDDVLLEPGAGRPQSSPATEGGQGPAPESEIRSSFIAAARRAAQAAAADSAQQKRGGRLGEALSRSGPENSADLVQRLRAMIDRHRRPILIGAAIVALALGSLQIVRNIAHRAPASAASQIETPPAAPIASTPVAPTAATIPDAPAPAAPAPMRAAPTPPALEGQGSPPAAAPADPQTTQSIAPRSDPAAAERQSTTIAPDVDPGSAMPPAGATAAAPAPRVASVNPAMILPPPAPAGRSPGESPAGEPSADLPSGLKHAALAGNPLALYDLASRTAEGHGVPRDPKVAASLFEKAAEKGLAPAQYRIGNSYEKGVGVTRDVEAAKTWYRKAAENGNIRAMHNLGVLLAEGTSGRPDYAAAIGWFQKAAEHGVRDSQFNLAVLYARGLGLAQDFGKSYTWFAIAAASGDADSGRKRDEIAARLTAADLASAKSAADHWHPAPANSAANAVQIPTGGWPEAPSKRASRGHRV